MGFAVSGFVAHDVLPSRMAHSCADMARRDEVRRFDDRIDDAVLRRRKAAGNLLRTMIDSVYAAGVASLTGVIRSTERAFLDQELQL